MRRLYYSDDEFGKAFSDKLKDHREIPPSGNWSDIVSKLNKRPVNRFTALRWAAATFLAVFFLGVLIHYSTQNQKQSRLSEKVSNNLPDIYSGNNNQGKVSNADAQADNTTISNTSKSGTTANNNIVPSNKISPSIANSTASNNNSVPISNLINDINNSISRIEEATTNASSVNERQALELQPLAALDINSISVLSATEPATEPTTVDKLTPVMGISPLSTSANNITSLDDSKKTYTITTDCSNSNLKFYGGIEVNPQNTYLLSSSVLKSPNLHYKFSPGYAVGVIGGYNIRPKLAVEVGLIRSNENQNYESSDQNLKLLNQVIQSKGEWIELNYYRVPVLFKYKIKTAASKCVCDESVNIIAGIDYGKFAGGSTYNATTTYNLTSDYIKNNDMQFVIGLERSKAISKHIVFNGGVRFAYSSSQISSTHSLRINELYKPHNFDSAITLSLTYR